MYVLYVCVCVRALSSALMRFPCRRYRGQHTHYTAFQTLLKLSENAGFISAESENRFKLLFFLNQRFQADNVSDKYG